MVEPTILAPRCPGCDSPPITTLLLPFFCADLDCRVISWDPYADPARFKATAHTVNLSLLEGS